MAKSRRKVSERGFVLIAMSVSMLLLLAVIGLAFDFGRIYIARNEAQVFTDAAAMTAASKLDGTSEGLARAREAVAHLPMRWNLGTQPFTGIVVEFSADGSQWDADPKEAGAVTIARVTAPANSVDIVFLRAVGGPGAFTVPSPKHRGDESSEADGVRRQKGHALLELALSAAVMVSCLTGTFRFGYTFYIYNELVTAVGNAGRYAAMRSYRAATPEDIEKGKVAIRNMAVYGNPLPSASAVPVVPNLTPEQIQVSYVWPKTPTGDLQGPPTAVDVSIVNYNAGTTVGTFTLDKRPSVEFPFVGRYAPQEREP